MTGFPMYSVSRPFGASRRRPYQNPTSLVPPWRDWSGIVLMVLGAALIVAGLLS